jgi:hypothetical protein
MRVATSIELSPEERKELEQVARARSLPAREVERARIVLRAGDGSLDKDIAAELGCYGGKGSAVAASVSEIGIAALRKDALRARSAAHRAGE